MHIYAQIGEFAASAGALEGFVYRRDDLDQETLRPWATNLSEAYRLLPDEARMEIQPTLDGSIGRALRSLETAAAPNSDVIRLLTGLVVNDRAGSPDDFQKTKWFQK